MDLRKSLQGVSEDFLELKKEERNVKESEENSMYQSKCVFQSQTILRYDSQHFKF